MSSNFDFLKSFSKDLHLNCIEAEKLTFSAPRTSVFYSRRSLEAAIIWMYDNDSSLKKPFQDSLSAMMHENTFVNSLGHGLFPKINLIRKLGNTAVHSDSQIRPEDALVVLKSLWSFMQWFIVTYQDGSLKPDLFQENLIARQESVELKAKELSELQEKLKAKDDLLRLQETKIKEYEDQKAERQKEVAANKAKNKVASDRVSTLIEDNLTEDQTRDLLIDVMLREVGWDPTIKNATEFEVKPFPNKSGVGYIDYVLWGKNGKPLGLVEAKKTKIAPAQGKRQAELYADALEKMFGQRPVIYYSNGYETWIWDYPMYPPREISGFHTQDELEYLVQKRSARNLKVSNEPISSSIVDRYYQKNAIKAVLETFEEKRRKALLVMATGTGKTRVAIALTDILMKNNWIRRVLFLADRNALVKQAKRNFTKHLPNLSTTNLTNEQESEKTRVIFSTYPTMMNAIDDTKNDNLKRFSPGYFDLIIIDEAHRSTYNRYKAIFDYFDAMLVGLTATPKDDLDKNTYEIFDLQDNMPTHAYELEDGIKDKFLVPYRSLPVPTRFHHEGIIYSQLSAQDKEAYEETFTDENGNLPPEIGTTELFNWVFNKDTVDKVITYVMENGIKVQGGDKLGKTIIFAKNHKHAVLINQRFDILYPKYAGTFSAVIDNEVNYADTLIDDFDNANKEPTIAISVDMLDTGIDIEEIVNLVFFKTVKSRSKFWQMIGRGTRLCPNLFGPDKDKTHFLIFDFCENFEFFSANPNGIESKTTPSLSQSIFTKRLEILETLTTSGENLEYKKSIEGQLINSIGKLDSDTFVNRPALKYIEKYKKSGALSLLSEGQRAEILQHILPLINPEEGDELSRRFDNLILSMQRDFLSRNTVKPSELARLVKIARGLRKKINIPDVASHRVLIESVLDANFAQGITIHDLEIIRTSFRNLIRLLDQEDGADDVYTNFEDEVLELIVGAPEAPLQNLKLDDYKEKLKAVLLDQGSNTTLYKIRHGRPVTQFDISELERILFADNLDSKDQFKKLYGENQPLTVFARQVVGLDRSAVMAEFSEVLGKVGLSKSQTDFLQQIIEHLTQNGIMEVEALYEAPFTDYHSSSIDGLFPNDADNIISIIGRINQTAYIPGSIAQ